MQLSVIILNYNVRYFLEQCVLSVQKALVDLDAEIIVVDNNSSDDSCLMMKQLFPQITLIENKENLGFPKGNNIAAQKAKGEFICILNPDTVVAEDTFKKLLAKSCQLSIGIIGCKLIDGTGNFLPESKRGLPTPYVAITKIFGLYKISKFFGKYYAQHLTENQSGKVDILVGAFMMMKRDLYIKVGGFDENCFMYSDDIDLSYMIQKLGKENFYFHETTVIHYKGESTIKDEKYIKHFREAMQFFYTKHFKKSWFFDKFLQIGSLLYAVFKQKKQQKLANEIDKYLVFSTENIQLNLNKPIEYLTDFKQFTNNEKLNIEVVFDANSFSFTEIIHFMEKHKSKNITFKNYISQSNYLIGSNNSTDRGEVLIF